MRRLPRACSQLDSNPRRWRQHGGIAGTDSDRLVDIGGKALEMRVVGQGEPLVLETPERVHSLVLLEAAILGVPSIGLLMAGLASVIGLYQAGQKAEGIDAF